MTNIFLAALLLSAPVQDNAMGRELYDSLVQCAAFHSVEAGMTREGGDSAASHLAAANDYRAEARKQTAEASPQSADREIDAVTVHYRKMLAEGDPKDMAKSWTSLESACRELHRAKAQLSAPPLSENSR
jgi:hypothetical protein